MARHKIDPKFGKATQFPHNDPTKGGGKKKIYTILKDHGYSKADIEAAFLEMAFSTKEETTKLKNKKDVPNIIRILSSEFLGNEYSGAVSDIMKHVIGMPTQKINAKVNGDIIPIVTKEV